MVQPLFILPKKRFPVSKRFHSCSTFFSLACLFSLSGCAVHRVNLAPLPAMGANGTGVSAEKEDVRVDTQEPWWRELRSEELNLLTNAALTENFDVVAARERLNQALALYRKAGGALKPELRLTAAFDADVAAEGRSLREDAWEFGGDVSWEVDFFKRLGSSKLARAADVQTRRHLKDAVRLALSVGVAESYFGIVEQRQLLALLAKQQQTSRELLRIIERRYEQGLVSRLDVLQQQAQVAEVDSQIPSAEAQLLDLQNQLGALLSATPGTREVASIGEQATFPSLPELTRLGSPDELLSLRPDLRAARSDLVSADAETGRAMAERLPRLTFSAEALLLEGRGPDGGLVTFAADLVQPLLDWGQRRAEWVRTKAVYRERLATFTQTYVRAVWNLDTLVRSEAKQRELLKRLHDRKQLLDATLGLATSRYTSGLTDYLPVLSATQQLYALDQRLIREQRRLTSLRIALHQSLGGPLPAEEAKTN
jgi:NodT family efflux transporter outer membrane factor (OMF) lipoprotein